MNDVGKTRPEAHLGQPAGWRTAGRAAAQPTAAFAAGQTSWQQIEGEESPVYYSYDAVDQTWTQADGATVSNSPAAGVPEVRVSKTIQGTDEENVFDITLEVETDQKIQTTTSSPDAAVVLVLDLSSSMDRCAECGGSEGNDAHRQDTYCTECGGWHSFRDWYHNGICDVPGCRGTAADHETRYRDHAYQSRLDAAKETAASFLDEFAADAQEGDKRMVALVTFGNGAQAVDFQSGWGETYWLDVSDPANLSTVKGAINSTYIPSTPRGVGTNIDAGLRVAYALWKQSATTQIDYRYNILLTDGEPTYNVDRIFSTNTNRLSYGSDENAGPGSNATKDTTGNAATVAQAIQDLKSFTDTPTPVTFYSVYYGSPNDEMEFHEYSWGKWRPTGETANTAGWLSGISDEGFTAENADGLNQAFEIIIERIKLAVDAWKVTDPMGQYITFEGIQDEQGAHAAGALEQLPENGEGGTLVWNLRAGLFSKNTTITKEDGTPLDPEDYDTYEGACTLSYTLTYRVRLNTEDMPSAALVGANEADVYHLTNGHTYLDYYLTNSDGQYIDDDGNVVGVISEGGENTEAMQTLSFNVPKVKGYEDTLSFKKVAAYDEKVELAGAEFQLAHNGCCDAAPIPFTSLSSVYTQALPSGHTYVLTETKAPDGYTNEGFSKTVEVRWGELYVDGEAWTGGTMTNSVDPSPVPVTVTKEWQTAEGQRPAGLVITFTGKTGDGATVSENEHSLTLTGPTWTGTVQLPTRTEKNEEIVWTAEEDLSGTSYVPSTEGGNAQTVQYDRRDGKVVSGRVTFTNKVNETVDLVINKVWLMPADMAKDVTVKVMNGDIEVTTATIKAGETSVTVSDLPAYDANGAAIQYTVVEDTTGFDDLGYDAPAYSTNELGQTVITNAVEQETFSINGTKVWVDGGRDHSGETITVTLTGKVGDNVVYEDKVLLDNDAFTFTGVPVYDIVSRDGIYTGTGEKIVYTVADDAKGYVSEGTLSDVVDGSASATLKNTIEDIDQTMDIEGTKVWNDSNNAYGTRPESVDLTLQKQTADGWVDVRTVTVGNGAVQEEGEVIEPEEPQVSEDVTPDTGDGAPVETTAPEEELPAESTEPEASAPVVETEPAVEEPAAGEPQPEEEAPAAEIDTGLTTNGPVAGAAGGRVVLYTVYKDQVVYRFEDLPVYDTLTGAEIQYRVEEKDVPQDYVAQDGTADNSWTVTNTLDSGDEGTEGTITVYKTWVDPYTDTTRHVDAAITVSGGGYSETEEIGTNGPLFFQVPLYAGGEKVTYTVTEAALEGYTTTVDGEAGNETTVQAGGSVTFVNTIAQAQTEPLVATKTWDDDLIEGYKENRPTFTLSLYRTNGVDGTEPELVATVEGDRLPDESTYDFGAQDRYDLVTGREWRYYVTETYTGGELKDHYTWSYSVDADSVINQMHVVNTFTNTTVEVSGRKLWSKPDNVPPTQAEIEAVEISVYKSTDPDTAIDTVKLADADGDGVYTYTFEGLPEYDAATGEKIVYVVRETAGPEGYTATVSDADGRTITNTSKDLSGDSSKVTITVSKTWVGPQSDRPDSISITLKGSDGSSSEHALTKENNYYLEIAGLPKYDSNNDTITYTVEETDAETDVNGDLIYTSEGGLIYDVTVAQEGYRATITNTIRQTNDTAVEGEKLWSGEIPEAFTAEPVTIQLYANGVAVEGKTDTVGETPEDATEPDWSFSFTGLPTYALPGNGVGVADTNGEEIVYTVKEVVDGTAYDSGSRLVFTQDDVNYQFTVTGGSENDQGKYDVTNTFEATEVYQYQVIGHYITITDGVAGADQTQIIKEPTKVAQGSSPVAGQSLIDANTTGPDGNTYTYDPGHDGEVLTVVVENANVMYELHVYYIREVTADPGDPTDPVDPPDDDRDPVDESEVIVTPDRPGTTPDTGDGGDVTIDDDPTPQGPLPDEPTEPTEPTEPSEPTQPSDPGDGTTIIEEQPPMGDLPQTGTMARHAVDPTTTLGILAMSLSMVAAGLAISIGRKKEEPMDD